MTGITEIATVAVTALAPFMPHLISAGKAGGKKLIETIAEKGGEAAWARAQGLWAKLKRFTADTPELQGAALSVAANPDDETFRQALTKAIIITLDKHPETADSILELLGGWDSIQEVLIRGESRGKRISQNLEGAGKQRIEISDGSSGSDISQRKT